MTGSPLITFTTTIQRDDRSREKMGWSYVIIPAAQARKLNKGSKLGFRVKGFIDDYALKQISVLPMGDSTFMLPVNGTMRKALRKQRGDKVTLRLAIDKRKVELSKDLMLSLADEPNALEHFNTLPMSHRQYFSRWIESAKTEATKTRRIVSAVIALSQKKGYGEMLREKIS